MSYSSTELLNDWKLYGKYPAIHYGFAEFIRRNLRSHPHFIDIGCHYGLLGRQLIHIFDGKCPIVLGIDKDPKAIIAGREAGVEFARCILQPLAVNHENLKLLSIMIDEYEIEVLVARRTLPEVFGETDEAEKLARDFFNMISDHGVREIFLQGRQVVPKPKNRLSSVAQEIEMVMDNCSAWAGYETSGPYARIWI